jgi:CRISPR/Cas system-associated exonuclease Cas4 (RecB family)
VSGSRTAVAPPERPRGGFLQRAEVRDVLAWLRLLVDPHDAGAVVRALSRPPIELRQVELARVIQVARRRKLDMVAGLAAATEAPQVPPEARERIQRFIELHRAAVAELDSVAPDVLVARLIERLGVRGRKLLAPADAAEQRASLELLHRLAAEFTLARPGAGARELVRHLATVVPDAPGDAHDADPSPARPMQPPTAGDTAADASHANADPKNEEQLEEEPLDALHATFQLLREEVLEGIARIGGRLGELRLDTELDISHGVVRYLELLKLSALLQRQHGQDVADALADVNARLLAATTPLQREIFQTSTLDATLGAHDGGARADAAVAELARARATAPREEQSLAPFLPRNGAGVALSASDIHTYRSCPLRYKYARVLRIPTEQTVHQRFGIVVHQVLERYHADGGHRLAQLLALLDAGWRRAGFALPGGGDESQRDRELYQKARAALTRYHARLGEERSRPVWFERSFDFRLGPHRVRGRVDRVDRVGGGVGEGGGGDSGERAGAGGAVGRGAGGAGGAGEARAGEYELIDYKTSRPRSAEQLRDDVQLSLYALAAREDWGLAGSRQAYYYVLDDVKVPVVAGPREAETVRDVVLEVGDRILAERFEPTPSRAACSICDYRIVCPAAEG